MYCRKLLWCMQSRRRGSRPLTGSIWWWQGDSKRTSCDISIRGLDIRLDLANSSHRPPEIVKLIEDLDINVLDRTCMTCTSPGEFRDPGVDRSHVNSSVATLRLTSAQSAPSWNHHDGLAPFDIHQRSADKLTSVAWMGDPIHISQLVLATNSTYIVVFSDQYG